jgi:hypothetical protein
LKRIISLKFWHLSFELFLDELDLGARYMLKDFVFLFFGTNGVYSNCKTNNIQKPGDKALARREERKN